MFFMLLLSLILIQLFGILIFFVFFTGRNKINRNTIKIKALIITTLALLVSLITWFLCDNSCKYLQFVQKHYTIGHYDFYLGLVNLLIYFVLLIALTVLFFFFLSSKSNTNNTSIKQSSFPLVEFILCSFLVSLITGLFDNLYMWVTSDYIPCNWEKWFAFNEETRNKVLIALSSGDLELLRSTYKILFATLQQNCIFLKNTEIIFYNQPFGMKEINNLSYFEVYVEDFSKLLVNLEVEIKKLS